MNEAQQYKRDYILFCYKGMIFGLIGIIIVLILSMFMGCRDRTFIENSYSTLETAKLTYDAVMSSSADLYKKGIIDDDGKIQIIKYGTQFLKTYNLATDLLITYAKTEQAEDKEKIITALKDINNILFDIGQLLKPADNIKE